MAELLGLQWSKNFSHIFNNYCPLSNFSYERSHLLRACLSHLLWGNYLEGVLPEA